MPARGQELALAMPAECLLPAQYQPDGWLRLSASYGLWSEVACCGAPRVQ